MPLIDLDDARAALRIPTTITDRDAVIIGYIDAATLVIEDIVGPIEQATRTETFDGGRDRVVLSSPAASVTSVTVNGTAVDYVPNLTGGVVYGGTSNFPVSFLWGRQNVVVTYTVGAATVPANIAEAAVEFVRWRYQNGQQQNRPTVTGPGADGMMFTPSGYSVPRAVWELCAANQRAPGVG